MFGIENMFFSEVLENFLQERKLTLTDKEKEIVIKSLVNDEELAKKIEEFIATTIYFKIKKGWNL